MQSCEALFGMATEIQSKLSVCKEGAHKTDNELIGQQNRLGEINKQIRAIESNLKKRQEDELKELEEMDTAEAKESRAKLLNVITLGIFGYFGKMKHHPEVHERKRLDFYGDQLRLKKLEEEKIEEMRNVALNISALIGGDNDKALAQEAINMAIAGLDEVTSAIEYYKNFIKEIHAQTELACKKLSDLVNMGYSFNLEQNQVSSYEREIFTEDFKSSAWMWLSLACLGNKCVDLLGSVQEEVLERLRLKDIDPKTN